MARTAGGVKDLAWAREQVAKARSADALRQAQANLLPLELGLSLERSAVAIGRSVSLTGKLRNRRRREKHFHNRAFDSPDALENQLVGGLLALENNRGRVKSICNRDWIINALSNAN